ncbi:MAG TPA: hypothetical protein VJQ44_15760 [Gemmatimonadales bacterium]|nr:hypothetical protein [Gemmatimonadales bacterium]
MDRPGRHGIPKDRDKESDYTPEDPDYDHAANVGQVLEKWALAWQEWIVELAGEFKTAIEQYPEKKGDYTRAKRHWNAFGRSIAGGSTKLLKDLNSIYKPDARLRDILTDATKPPPPPFGGGRDPDDEDDGN